MNSSVLTFLPNIIPNSPDKQSSNSDSHMLRALGFGKGFRLRAPVLFGMELQVEGRPQFAVTFGQSLHGVYVNVMMALLECSRPRRGRPTFGVGIYQALNSKAVLRGELNGNVFFLY